jgi:hypothetical protein
MTLLHQRLQEVYHRVMTLTDVTTLLSIPHKKGNWSHTTLSLKLTKFHLKFLTLSKIINLVSFPLYFLNPYKI